MNWGSEWINRHQCLVMYFMHMIRMKSFNSVSPSSFDLSLLSSIPNGDTIVHSMVQIPVHKHYPSLGHEFFPIRTWQKKTPFVSSVAIVLGNNKVKSFECVKGFNIFLMKSITLLFTFIHEWPTSLLILSFVWFIPGICLIFLLFET